MRILAKIVALALLVIGLVVFGFGMMRYRLPYENGRYFDPQKQVVYHLEAAEVSLGAGALLGVTGLAVATAVFRGFLHRNGRSKS